MQGLMVVGLIVEEILNVDVKCVKGTGVQNIGQGKVGRQIPPPVFTSGICRYLPVWKILLKWQILANTGKLKFFWP